MVLVAACVWFCGQRNADQSAEADTNINPAKISKYQSYIDSNDDFVGYIKIDGPDIDYLVVQGEDDGYVFNYIYSNRLN